MHKKYPKKLLPTKGYLTTMSVSELLKRYSSLAVVRLIEKKDLKLITKDHKSELSPDTFNNIKVTEFSVNILGGGFHLSKHKYFRPTLKLVQNDWDGTTFLNLPISHTAYSIKNDMCPIYYLVSDFENFTFPYEKSINKSDYDRIKTKAIQIIQQDNIAIRQDIVGEFGIKENNQTQVTARVRVNHHPNLLNYWHMQIDSYAVDREDYIKYDDNSKEAKHIYRQLRHFLVKNGKLENMRKYHINHCLYKDVNPFYIQFWDRLLDIFYDKKKVNFYDE